MWTESFTLNRISYKALNYRILTWAIVVWNRPSAPLNSSKKDKLID